jgi:hypothetical protein
VIAVSDQVDKEIEDLGRDSHQVRPAAQFAPIRVEDAISE